jgi:hypothetical protein
MRQSLTQYKRAVFNDLMKMVKSPDLANLYISMNEGVKEIESGFQNNDSTIDVASEIYSKTKARA